MNYKRINNNMTIKKHLNINKNKCKSYRIYALIFVISGILFLLIPTSKDTLYYNKSVELFLINAIIILFIIIQEKKILSSLLLVMVEFSILIFYTVQRYNDIGFSDLQLGVALQYIVFGLLSITKISPRFNYNSKVYSNIFLNFNLIMIIWGLGLVLRIPLVIEFTFNNYSHQETWMLSNMLKEGKPILSFHVHSIAAYFWAAMFFLNYLALKYELDKRRNIHIVFMLLNFTLCLLCKSTTSFIFLFIMFPFIIWAVKDKKKQIIIILLCAIVLMFFIQSSLFEYYLNFVLSSDIHGFSGRYGSNLFVNFFGTVRDYGHTGIAINDARYVYDSGLVANYMRGGIPLIITYYGSMIVFFFGNLNRKHALFASAIFLGLDLITVAAMYPYVVSFIIFAIIYINYLYNINIKN